MKKLLMISSFICFTLTLFAQTEDQPKDTSWKKIHRYTPDKINNLVHTKLQLKPDYSKSHLYGKAWITLTPHFYPTDSLRLDAKGMEINKVAMLKSAGAMSPLKYDYDGLSLNINLGKTYKRGEKYVIYIDYIAKPNEYEAKIDGALLGVKGIYFINPRGEEKDKPTQIWTQGETESSSVWFPTIDKTNQKTTQELTVTVPSKFVTLSNGKLISQTKNADGTRTDYWKMELPHSPYLFFLGVGDYAIIKDSWRGKEVSYYVEKEYASVARKIFGNTPEMINFFSRITGVHYPWVKYAQITGRDYVAGAMENTTATLHQESAQQDARQLVDGNMWESTIAHELFHQWFGDYVTTESWSNLTLNESFADYSQTLWDEYKYGKDAGDAENYQGLQSYLQSGSDKKELVRFQYADREDMFDQVSYQKGGRILHMLRTYVGDSAFFKSINLYLTANKFKSAEAHQLRLAFEEITGKDLTWFFNQWYFGSGHPLVSIDYVYDDNAGKVNVILKQNQKSGKLFTLPIAIDIYNGAEKERHQVWVRNAVDTFTFTYAKRPDLVNVDGDKVMLWAKKDNKTIDNYIHQYKYAARYLDRREAIEYAGKNQKDPKAFELVKLALKDKYPTLRNLTVSYLDLKNENVKKQAEPILLDIAKNDQKSVVRAIAIHRLAEYKNPEYKELFKSATKDSSYTVSGNALNALLEIDNAAALELVKELEKTPSKGVLRESLKSVKASTGDENFAEEIIDEFKKMPLSQSKFEALGTLGVYLGALKNTEKVKDAVDEIVKFRDDIPDVYKSQTDPYINGVILQGIISKKEEALKAQSGDASLKDLVTYIKSKLPGGEKKGF